MILNQMRGLGKRVNIFFMLHIFQIILTIKPGLVTAHPRFQSTNKNLPPKWDSSILSYTNEADSYAYWNCHNIPPNMTLCKSVGYSRMVLPNFLQHESLREVIQQANVWVSLVNTDCHPDIQRFLCSLYAPICLKSHQEAKIPPCYELCDEVRNACLPRMRLFGFDWPDIVRCQQFPKLSESMCIPQQENKPVSCAPCEQAVTVENIASSYCMTDVVLRANFKEIAPKANTASLRLTLSSKSIALKLSKRDGTLSNNHEYQRLWKRNRIRRHQKRMLRSRRYRHINDASQKNGTHGISGYSTSANGWWGMQPPNQIAFLYDDGIQRHPRAASQHNPSYMKLKETPRKKRKPRDSRLYDLDGITEVLLGCSACSSLLPLTAKAAGSTLFSKKWLLMGRRIRDVSTNSFNHQLQVTFLTLWDRNSNEFRQAINAIRKQPHSVLCPDKQQKPSTSTSPKKIDNLVVNRNLKIMRSAPSIASYHKIDKFNSKNNGIVPGFYNRNNISSNYLPQQSLYRPSYGIQMSDSAVKTPSPSLTYPRYGRANHNQAPVKNFNQNMSSSLNLISPQRNMPIMMRTQWNQAARLDPSKVGWTQVRAELKRPNGKKSRSERKRNRRRNRNRGVNQTQYLTLNPPTPINPYLNSK